MQSKHQFTSALYASLDLETRIVVQQRTGEIKTLMQRTAQDLVEIGQKLVEVKARLGHGLFGPWLQAEFEWSERTAQRFMSVAQAFKSDTVSVLANADAKALYLLAAPLTPVSAREEAVRRAETGERITHSTAREMVQGQRQGVSPLELDAGDRPANGGRAAFPAAARPTAPEPGLSRPRTADAQAMAAVLLSGTESQGENSFWHKAATRLRRAGCLHLALPHLGRGDGRRSRPGADGARPEGQPGFRRRRPGGQVRGFDGHEGPAPGPELEPEQEITPISLDREIPFFDMDL